MSDAAPSCRRGRSARRERRQAGPAGLAIPYISRNIPNFDILSDEGAERIEANTDRILAEIGLEFRDDPEVIGIWKEAGAEVDGERVRHPQIMGAQ